MNDVEEKIEELKNLKEDLEKDKKISKEEKKGNKKLKISFKYEQ